MRKQTTIVVIGSLKVNEIDIKMHGLSRSFILLAFFASLAFPFKQGDCKNVIYCF